MNNHDCTDTDALPCGRYRTAEIKRHLRQFFKSFPFEHLGQFFSQRTV